VKAVQEPERHGPRSMNVKLHLTQPGNLLLAEEARVKLEDLLRPPPSNAMSAR
jgi:hypothetical protein